jgi:hypothetical protein
VNLANNWFGNNKIYYIRIALSFLRVKCRNNVSTCQPYYWKRLYYERFIDNYVIYHVVVIYLFASD